MSMHTQKFGMTLSEIHSARPATARIMVERSIDGAIHISSTLDMDDTIQMLDESMEAIDGTRLPPN